MKKNNKSQVVVEKPKCELIGKDGNVFNLIGIASGVLKRAGLRDQANELCEKCFKAQSYGEALNIIGEYVQIS